MASSCFALCAFVSSLNWRLTSLWHRLDFFEQRRTPSLQIVVLCSQENRAIQTRSRAIYQEARQPHTLLDNRLTSAPWMRRCKQILFELHVSFLMIANSMRYLISVLCNYALLLLLSYNCRHPKPAPQCCGSPRMSASIFLCVSKVFTLNIKGFFPREGMESHFGQATFFMSARFKLMTWLKNSLSPGKPHVLVLSGWRANRRRPASLCSTRTSRLVFTTSLSN